MTMSNEELREHIDRLIDKGDRAAMEKFALDNFTELPESMQKDVLLAFYEEALEKEADKSTIVKLQVQGLDALGKLEAIKADLES